MSNVYVIQFSNARYFAGWILHLDGVTPCVMFSDDCGVIIRDTVSLARLLHKYVQGLTWVAVPLGQGVKVVVEPDWVIQVDQLYVCRGGLTTELECASGWSTREEAEKHIPNHAVRFDDGLVNIVRRVV